MYSMSLHNDQPIIYILLHTSSNIAVLVLCLYSGGLHELLCTHNVRAIATTSLSRLLYSLHQCYQVNDFSVKSDLFGRFSGGNSLFSG